MINSVINILKKIFKEKNHVVFLKISGVIGSNIGIGSKSGVNIDSLHPKIEKAFKYKKAKAIILKINSPGGSPVQSELIANVIRLFAQDSNIPVIAFVEDIAASGGYWIACAASKIFAAKNSLIGSIGVVSSGFGYVKAIEKLGVERRVYTQGKNKSILDPFLPVNKDDLKIVDQFQKNVYQNFKEWVVSRRQSIIADDQEQIFSGAIWSAAEAKNLNLIDDIEDLYGYIHKEYGKDIKIIKINFEESWLKSKLSLLSETLLLSLQNRIEEILTRGRYS